MTDLLIPDVSEFNSVTSLPVAAIVRAHNGWRADHKWPQFAEIAKRDCRWWGAYQYLPKSVDPAQAARAFRATLGGYRPNVVILDLEEGEGNQLPRMQAWHAAIDWPAEWDYSGLNFLRTRGLAGQVEWIAAYQRGEPTDKHQLWQYTNAQRFPGIAAPCDGSVFHGSVEELIRLTSPPLIPTTVRYPVKKVAYARRGTPDFEAAAWYADASGPDAEVVATSSVAVAKAAAAQGIAVLAVGGPGCADLQGVAGVTQVSGTTALDTGAKLAALR